MVDLTPRFHICIWKIAMLSLCGDFISREIFTSSMHYASYTYNNCFTQSETKSRITFLKGVSVKEFDDKLKRIYVIYGEIYNHT